MFEMSFNARDVILLGWGKLLPVVINASQQ